MEQLPPLKEGDLIIGEKSDSSKPNGYIWYDNAFILIEVARRKGLQVTIDKETKGLRVGAEWPPADPPSESPEADAPHQITIEEYLKEKENKQSHDKT